MVPVFTFRSGERSDRKRYSPESAECETEELYSLCKTISHEESGCKCFLWQLKYD